MSIKHGKSEERNILISRLFWHWHHGIKRWVINGLLAFNRWPIRQTIHFVLKESGLPYEKNKIKKKKKIKIGIALR